jgi:protocatechuate 3,4-dioxygenase alpha subunit
MINGNSVGKAIHFTGCVYDGEGAPVCDAMIEIWQAGPDGRFDMPDFTNWGRQPADPNTGAFCFQTLKPGACDGQSPHILIWVVARGINLGLTTRAYFPDEDNSCDAVYQLAGARAQTLVCAVTETGYHLDIRLQGPNETVFFDV